MNGALRQQYLSRHLHTLGARAVDELLAEVGAAHGIEADVIARLERYAQLDRQMLVALGADRMPAPSLSLVVDNEIEGGEITVADDADRRALDSDGSAA